MNEGPRISFVLPEAWQFKEQVTLASTPTSPEQPRANLIVSSEPLQSELTTESYAESMATQAEREFPAYREISLEPMQVLGGDALLRRYEWEPEQGQKVTQLQVYLVSGDRMYTATATAETEDYEGWRNELMTALRHLSLASPPASAPAAAARAMPSAT
jgi:hypothetical protein